MSSVKTTFLVPKSLTWDKLTALYMQVYCVLGRMESWKDVLASGIRIVFEDDTNIPQEAIDVDVRQKYTASNGQYGSATDRVVQAYALTEDPGVAHLVRLLNENNRNGFLKDEAFSLVALIRALFTSHHTVERRFRVIEQLWDVVGIYLTACDEHADEVESWANPFVLPKVERMCELAHWPAAQTAALLEQIRLCFQYTKADKEQAAEKAEDLKALRTFDVRCHGNVNTVTGHYIRTDDSRIASHYFRTHPQVAVLIAQRRSGHYAFFFRGQQDVRALHAALEKKEPGKFYLFEPQNPGQSPMILNGSDSRAAVHSGRTPSEVIADVQEHHQHRSRRQTQAS